MLIRKVALSCDRSILVNQYLSGKVKVNLIYVKFDGVFRVKDRSGFCALACRRRSFSSGRLAFRVRTVERLNTGVAMLYAYHGQQGSCSLRAEAGFRAP